MLKRESEAWIFLLIILAIFLYNMLPLVVGHPLLPITLTFSTHMNHVHFVPVLIIILTIVHHLDNFVNEGTPNVLAQGLIHTNFYNLDCSNQSDFSWLAQATENYAHQFDEVHHSNYS
jgi:hypothetical protein